MIKNRNFGQSFKCALRGIFVTIKTQRNMRFHLSATVAILICAGLADIGETNFLFITIAIALVISAELINTAIESDVDLSTAEYHPFARDAKDIAAGGVLFAALAAIVIGCVVFFTKGRIVLLLTKIFSSWLYIGLTLIYVIVALIFIFCRKN